VNGAGLLEVFDLAVRFEVGEDVEEGGRLLWGEGCVCHGFGVVFIVGCLYAWVCRKNRIGRERHGKANATWCLLAGLVVMTRR
jgi:hypothetical protein